jgi:hypothetical protein
MRASSLFHPSRRVLAATLHAAVTAAGLLAAVACAAPPAAAQDTVHVDWMLSSDRKLVVLNAYRLDDGRIAGDSVGALLIERVPDGSATGRYGIVNGAYADSAAAPFFGMLGLSEPTMHKLTAPTGDAYRLRPDEWTMFFGKVLASDSVVIADSGRVVIFREAPLMVRRTAASWLADVVRSDTSQPVFPHLQSGWIASVAEADTFALDSAAIANRASVSIVLRNYGSQPATADLVLDSAATAAGFRLNHERLSLTAGEQDSVQLAFSGEQLGRHAGGLEVRNAAGPPVRLSVVANVVELPAQLGWLERFIGWLKTPLGIPVVAVVALAIAAFVMRRKLADVIRRRKKAKSRVEGSTSSTSVGVHVNHVKEAFQQTIVQLERSLEHIERLERENAATASLRREHEAVVGVLREAYPDDFPEVRVSADDVLPVVQERLASLLQDARSRQGLADERDRLAGELESARSELVEARAARETAEEAARMAAEREAALSGERDQATDRLRAFADALQLAPERLERLDDTETQSELAALRQGYRPAFLVGFQGLIDDLVDIYRQVDAQAAEGKLRNSVRAMLHGPRGDTGLLALREKLVSEPMLLDALGLRRASELRDLTMEAFYERVMARDFKVILDEITRLGLYARIRDPEVEKWFTDEKVNLELLDRALHLVETRLRTDFELRMRTVPLFRTHFEDGKFVSAEGANLLHLRPELDSTVRGLKHGTIYDIVSVGLVSKRVGVDTQSAVAWQLRT